MKRALTLLFLTAFLWPFGAGARSGGEDLPQSLTVSPLAIETAGGTVAFEAELALTPEEQRIGLMFRRTMPENHGMLFYNARPAPLSMWMLNTYIPLDMLFIRDDGTIARIAENARPMSLEIISSGGPVAAVLELNGGAAEKYGIHIGDRVLHALFGTAGEGRDER